MIFGPKLLVACALGLGCYAPFHFFGGGKSPIPASFPWKVSSNPSFPLLLCQKDESKVLISLKLEESGQGNLEQGRKVIFVGEDLNSGEKLNLYEKVERNGGTFNLVIWGTGNHYFGEIGGLDSQKYKDNLRCNSIFKVTKYKYTSQQDIKMHSWESDFEKLKFSLDDCKTVNYQKQCGIKIDPENNLEWAPEIKPTVIL